MIRNFSRNCFMAAAACLILSACENSTGPEATLAPLEKWSFSGHESSLGSGIAARSRDPEGNLVPGVTVWLTDQAIDCAIDADDLPSMAGGWIAIAYPNFSLGKASVQVMVGYWPDGPGLRGNIVERATATLSQADTSSGKSVSGSLAFHSEAFDSENDFGKADIKGSFTVPYCPEI